MHGGALLAPMLLLLAAVVASSGQPLGPQSHFRYQIPRGVQTMGSVSQLRVPAIENSILAALNSSGLPPAFGLFVQRSGWTISYAIMTIVVATVLFVATLVVSLVECSRHSCGRTEEKKGVFGNPRESYNGVDKFLVRFLLSFMIALLVFGSAIAMYANAASFASIPSALGEVNVTVSTSSTKTSSVIARVQPVATDYNINIPKEVFTVDTFLKTSSALISGGTETGNSVANLAKALGSLPWVLPLLAAIIAIPFVVRAWRGFARVAIVLAIVSSLAIVLLVVPYTLMGFITTGECSNNVRQGLMNYVSASTSDKCAADVIQFYLLCVPLNRSGDQCDPVSSLRSQINKAIDDLNNQINQSNPNDPRRPKWIADRDTLNSTVPDVDYLTTCMAFSSTYVATEKTFCDDIAGHSALLFEIIFDSIFMLPLFVVGLLLAYYRLDPDTDALGGDYQQLDHFNAYGNMDAKQWPVVLGFTVVISLSLLAFCGLIVSVTVGRETVTIGS